MKKYRGLNVIEVDDKLFSGLYRNGAIFVQKGMEGRELSVTLRHEFEHHKFFKKHKLLRWFYNSNQTPIFLLAGSVLSLLGMKAGILLFAPFIILLAHEFVILAKTRDFGAALMRKLGVLVMFLLLLRIVI